MRSHTVCATLVFCVFISLTLLVARPVLSQEIQPTTTVTVTPTDDIQALVDGHSAYTTFILTKGVYRLQSVTPKTNNTFIGEAGTILSGARLLTVFGQRGPYWVVENQQQQGKRFGRCETQRIQPPVNNCMLPEDLFFDDVLLTQVTSLSEVTPGTWYFDYATDTIFMADNPTNRKVEASVLPHAFQGSAQNVLIQGLIIEKYASPGQEGAIHGQTGHAGLRSRGWIVENNEIRWNHAIGIRLGEDMHVRNNVVHHNGQLGIGGSGSNVVIEGNEIAHNNIQGFHWHIGGGTKFVTTIDLVVRQNFVHHNFGPGLWSDVDNLNTLYEDNHVLANKTQGIFHEASYHAIIRNNLVEGNGFGDSIWHVGSGILVSSSPNVEIYGNQVLNNADGIGLIQDHTRIEGKFGPRELKNAHVHDNVILMAEGQTGIGVTNSDPAYVNERNNRFENNTYVLYGKYQGVFKRLSINYTIAQWQNFGQDVASNFIRFPSLDSSTTLWNPPDMELVPLPTSSRIEISPGSNIQTIVDSQPEGTAFTLKAGIHRLQHIRPKNGNKFIGEVGSILSGARELENFTQQGQYWIADNQIQQGPTFGLCDEQLELSGASCRHPEDLFLDNVPLVQVSKLADLEVGKWFFDYDADKIYLADNPKNRRVEASIIRHAFEGMAQNVFISGLIIEKYANPAQEGAVHSRVGHSGPLADGWTIQENEIRLNHGIGIRVGNFTKVLKNNIHHNGQLGVGGSGRNIQVIGNEIANNNTQGFAWDWESGGARFVWTNMLNIIGNDIHHNTGPGLYTNPENRSTHIEANRVAFNEGAGIRHSASYHAVIKGNIVEGNGFGERLGHNGAGILVTGSPDVEIVGNILTRNAYGILAVQTNRGDGHFGPRDIENFFVHDNIQILSPGKTGLRVLDSDLSFFTSRNNQFSHNIYMFFSHDELNKFHWLNKVMTASEWKDEQQDLDGKFVILP
ncbi:MAG: right-handed parallel beta-helix repeat-containing protein [Nitrospirales bacterium]|nr:right-handed parallel beta-helix repeat-containing protein [Nitrospira sp.]MDR4502676.1 right-handed parallel beta-helix repeat-containing protein [Nitrospirales bacterium]